LFLRIKDARDSNGAGARVNMDDLQKRTAQAIVNIFETGRPLGDYGQVTLLAGDTGQLTYGRAQTTLASGNLYLLIKAYCSDPNAQFGAELRQYLDALQRCDPALNQNAELRTLLREAGGDLVMQSCQDAFFDRVYWAPAMASADALGVKTALGAATIYDSTVHGAWRAIRDLTTTPHGDINALGEKTWIAAYVATRPDWLANNANALLHKTVYRMDALQKLIDDGSWELPLPLSVRGIMITEDVLMGSAPVRASAQLVEERPLRLRSPYMQGDDVKQLQTALEKAGFAVDADGIFGPGTAEAVVAFLSAKELVADGIVGAATRAAIGL
jgi:chitosanase